jgi:hypothetical protein
MISGCKSAPENRLEKIAGNAPDAVPYLLNELKTKRIIFIGDDSTMINDELFLAEHLQSFYDAGVRFIFTENNLVRATEQFFPAYPWITGDRVERDTLKAALASLEQATKQKDPLHVIAAEALFIEPAQDFPNQIEWMNYRSERIAAAIIETMDTAPDAKAIVYITSLHGIKTSEMKQVDAGTQAQQIPLGLRLAEHYGAAFSSFNFILLREDYTAAWERLTGSQKIIMPKDFVNSDIFYPGSNRQEWYDGFIVEEEHNLGTVRSYVPTDTDLRFLVKFLKGYAAKDPQWEWVTFSQEELDAAYFLDCYYLKLYYGEHFNYAVWKTPDDAAGQSLSQAVEELEAYWLKAQANPSKLLAFQYPVETIRAYCSEMYYSLLSDVLQFDRPITDSEVVRLSLAALQSARELFPEDIWSLYWMAFIQTENGAYEQGLLNFQALFAHDLSRCMPILPLAYKKAARCAAEQGDQSLAAAYTALSESLYNEQGADPTRGPFSIETGYHLGDTSGKIKSNF